MLCISGTSIVAYSWGRRTGFPVVMAGITTETGVNHFHLAMSQLFSLERGGIKKAEKRGFIIRNLAGRMGPAAGGYTPPHGLHRYVPPIRAWFLRVSLLKNIGQHFCPCWLCLPGVILRQGTVIMSDKIWVRKYPVKGETNHLLKLNFTLEY